MQCPTYLLFVLKVPELGEQIDINSSTLWRASTARHNAAFMTHLKTSLDNSEGGEEAFLPTGDTFTDVEHVWWSALTWDSCRYCSCSAALSFS